MTTTSQNDGGEIATPRTEKAMSDIERIHTKVAKNVTTCYKAAFYALGNDCSQLERELHQANLQIAMDTIRLREIAELGIKRDIELKQSTKKLEIVAELHEALEHLHDCIDLCKGHGTPIIKDRAICYLSMMETEQVLSRAANL